FVSSNFALALLGLAACNSQPAGGSSGTTTMNPNRPGCSRGVVEPDLSMTTLSGPGVDPTTAQLEPLPSTALISTTYLTLRSDPRRQQRFTHLMSPILEESGSPPARGPPGVMLGPSPACSTGRTLGVWKDEMSMLAFVAGPAHAAAVDSVGEVSTGGS